MRGVGLYEFGGPEVLQVIDLPEVHAGPGEPAGTTEVWLLGSHVESAHLAAKMGLPFSYAHFFGNGAENGPLIAESYRRHFCPSPYLAQPQVNVGVHVLCAETEAEALRLATSRNLMKLRSALGVRRASSESGASVSTTRASTATSGG
jgi:alkanesulfonate monooxygenase SsuD/methylene tetrahydromethanopterin reductase-like flavin-dependent oxidoreductase (luciferase family)